MSHLARDRAMAMRALMPKAYADRTTTPAAMYRGLTKSGKAEVDRVVAAFGEVRRQALTEVMAGNVVDA